MAHRIAVLMHERQNLGHVGGYLIGLFSRFWQEDGHEVRFLFGTAKREPADLILVHVDLSVVPSDYIEFAESYPVALNARAHDIRKSTYSEGILEPGDRWNGQVIVKTELNYAGAPEARLLGRTRGKNEEELELELPSDYPIFDDLSLVPREYFEDPNLIVQRFVPELDRGDYCVRTLSFLGDESTSVRLRSKHPIVNGPTVHASEAIEPDPEMFEVRAELGLDYGKLDYVVTGQGAILLDVNKTIGVARNLMEGGPLAESRLRRARGIYRYLES